MKLRVLMGFFIFLFLFHTFFEFAVVEGNSMYPTYKDHQLVLVRKHIICFPNDVVKAVDNQGFIVVKRISGVQRDMYFLLGDNSQFSLDSRKLGPVTKNQIKGVVICQLI
jgi:nickel-type superoxide dismutase maturation protease